MGDIRKNIYFTIILLLLWLNNGFVFSQVSGGYLITKNRLWAIWWVENTYKVFRKDQVPSQHKKISLQSAKNEIEGFQLVISSFQDVNDITITVSDLANLKGEVISNKNVTIRNIEYVHVTKPSGLDHKAGWYPDPLPLCEEPFSVKAGINHPVWIDIRVPEGVSAGIYKGEITVGSSGYEEKVPVSLEVWNFSLPEFPFMRSAIGLYKNMIRDYHHSDNDEELDELIDLYFQSYKHYRISPQEVYQFFTVEKTISGIAWDGGTFDPDTVYEGRYSYQITDHSHANNVYATHEEMIEISPGNPYLLTWMSKTKDKRQVYSVVIKNYDADKRQIEWYNQGMIYNGTGEWEKDSLLLDPQKPFSLDEMVIFRPFPPQTHYISIHFYPNIPNESGSSTGTVWFDNIQLIDQKTKNNLITFGDFEQEIEKIDLTLDFSRFDKAARKYLDEFGFNGFRITLPECHPGPFVGRKTGWFHGFIGGTPEYKKLMTLYLKGLQDHFEANGWLGKEYLYWVDEPKQEEYDFVREGMKTIHEVAPKLKRFITENNPGPEIMDVTDMGCPVLAKLDPDKSKKWIEQGREMWSYLMTWPKAPHNNLFIDSDAINLRMWLWMSYRYQLTGILIWSANYWNASGCSPSGMLQNKWEDPMTYHDGSLVPAGAFYEYGNGDGVLFYPPKRDPNRDKSKFICEPIPSLRLEILREGLEDYDYMILLEKAIKQASPKQQNWVKQAKKILSFGVEVFVNEQEYTKNHKVLMKKRKEIGELLHKFVTKE